MRTILKLLLAATLAAGGTAGAGEAPAAPGGGALTWLPWSSDLFARAKAEHRLVLLDLEAVWCHWCHVMDETTYRDDQVTVLLRSHFLVVRVDQDSRPDLATRYEDYGWPATILFDASGRELAKRSGYIEPRKMASMLQAFVDDPTPGPSVVAAAPMVPERTGTLGRARREKLEATFDQSYDADQGAMGVDPQVPQCRLPRVQPAARPRRGSPGPGAGLAQPRCRARAVRPGLGRRIPILDQRGMDRTALREDHVLPGGLPAQLCPGLRPQRRSDPPPGGPGGAPLPGRLPHCTRGRFLRQPGCRSGPRRA